MRKWSTANGGWMALIILGLLTLFPSRYSGYFFSSLVACSVSSVGSHGKWSRNPS